MAEEDKIQAGRDFRTLTLDEAKRCGSLRSVNSTVIEPINVLGCAVFASSLIGFDSKNHFKISLHDAKGKQLALVSDTNKQQFGNVLNVDWAREQVTFNKPAEMYRVTEGPLAKSFVGFIPKERTSPDDLPYDVVAYKPETAMKVFIIG